MKNQKVLFLVIFAIIGIVSCNKVIALSDKEVVVYMYEIHAKSCHFNQQEKEAAVSKALSAIKEDAVDSSQILSLEESVLVAQKLGFETSCHRCFLLASHLTKIDTNWKLHKISENLEILARK